MTRLGARVPGIALLDAGRCACEERGMIQVTDEAAARLRRLLDGAPGKVIRLVIQGFG